MNYKYLPFAVLLFVILLLVHDRSTEAWGFWSHRQINRYAILSLPADMKPFFNKYAETIIERSVEPDTKRHSDSLEQFHHYIDIDRYGAYPFNDLPRNYDSAIVKFGKGRVDSSGIVPWRIADFTAKLTRAMKQRRTDEIIYYASYIGHYVADAHVTLHTTDNYDGQHTNQKGIHSRWESRIPEMFGDGFNLRPQDVEYVRDPLHHAFAVVLESYLKVDSVLAIDLEALASVPENRRFKSVERRGKTETQLSDDYYREYHTRLNGMVERRLNESIKGVASYWYTAWVDAGRPDLLE